MTEGADPVAPRLTFRRLGEADLDVFHRLVTDPHVRRYLLDGEVMTRAWAASEIEAARRLFETHGVGLWLLEEDGEVVGFAGFRVFDDTGKGPQLLYALLAPAYRASVGRPMDTSGRPGSFEACGASSEAGSRGR